MSIAFAAEIVDLNLEVNGAGDKVGVIRHMCSLLAAAGRCDDVDLLVSDVLAREEIISTGLGDGVAIPHARSAAVQVPSVAIGRHQGGIDFGADDGPATLIFLIAAPDAAGDQHLEILANLARRLVHDEFKDALKAAESASEVIAILNQEDSQ